MNSSALGRESSLEFEINVRRLLVARLDVPPEALEGVDSATPLLGMGIGLDSVEALTLASEIEAEYGIHFEDEELTPDLFHTLGSISASIAEKCRNRAVSPARDTR
jgi:acyl carrier protein